MGLVKAFPVSDIRLRGEIRRDDVDVLRAMILEDGVVEASAAAALIDLDRCCSVQDAAWAPFLADTVADHIVDQVSPEGYVTAPNASWLIAQIAPAGRVATRAGFEVLVRVLEKARWAPVTLSCLALEQLRQAVAEGDGPLRHDRSVPAGTIGAGEVEMVRRILYAFASDGHFAITRAEAEVMIGLDEALSSRTTNADWTDLLTKVLINVTMTASGYAGPTREAALAPAITRGPLEAGGPGTAVGAYVRQSSEERALARLERQRVEIITNEQILGDEAGWLAARMSGPARSRPAFAALAAVIRRGGIALHPELAKVVGEPLVAAA